MSLARLRSFFFPGLLASLAALAMSYRLELVVGLVPCALCMSQRLMLGLYGVVCLLALIHRPGGQGRHGYVWLALSCASVGALLAGRHVWLQGGAPPALGCPLPMLEQPLADLLVASLWGSADCAAISWSFLDLTLPEWSLLAFVLLALPPVSALWAYRFRQLGTL